MTLELRIAVPQRELGFAASPILFLSGLAIISEDERSNFQVFNAGGGRAVTVLEFAEMMIREFGANVEPHIPGEFRIGDTRHTISDNSKLNALGWEPTVPVEQNVREYVAWMREQEQTAEYLEEAERIMREQGVVQSATKR